MLGVFGSAAASVGRGERRAILVLQPFPAAFSCTGIADVASTKYLLGGGAVLSRVWRTVLCTAPSLALAQAFLPFVTAPTATVWYALRGVAVPDLHGVYCPRGSYGGGVGLGPHTPTPS